MKVSEKMATFAALPAARGRKAKTPETPFFGRLRRELMWTLGDVRAAGMMVRLGMGCGLTETARTSELPILGELKRINIDRETRQADVEVQGSAEAREFIRLFGPTRRAVCSITTGYLAGVLSRHLDHPVYAVEVDCVAKGDATCHFRVAPRTVWDAAQDVDLSPYGEDNITVELREAREQLRLTKDRYQTLFEQSDIAILIADPETGRIVNANVAVEEIVGVPRDELLTRTVFDVYAPADHNRILALLKAGISGESSDGLMFDFLRTDGEKRTASQSTKTLMYGGERVVQIILRDITDLKASEQKEKDLQSQLIRSERLSSIGRLAAGVAHELKNPLGAIRNAIYFIRNAVAGPTAENVDPQLRQMIKLAEDEVDAAVVIIGELLDFSRVIQLVKRRTSINELLERLPHMVPIPPNVELKWNLDVTLPAAHADPDRLSQVFANMVSNAVQAMPGGGRLTIRSGVFVETHGEAGVSVERIVVTFEDTGTGIDPAHISKIFEPLFTTKTRGTGLGLAISHNIVQKHEGTIQVTSQPGRGTTFIIKIPLHAGAEAAAGKDRHP